MTWQRDLNQALGLLIGMIQLLIAAWAVANAVGIIHPHYEHISLLLAGTSGLSGGARLASHLDQGGTTL